MESHNMMARARGAIPMVLMSFIDNVNPTRNNVMISSLFASNTIKTLIDSGNI